MEKILAQMDEMLDLDRVSEVMLYLPAGDGAAMHLIHEYEYSTVHPIHTAAPFARRPIAIR